MLSPLTRRILDETVRSKKRRLADLHLSLASLEADVRGTRTDIAHQQSDIAALEGDLERDDQARADAGADFPTETITPVDTEPADDQGLVAELFHNVLAAARPPVSLTGSHLTATTTAQEG